MSFRLAKQQRKKKTGKGVASLSKATLRLPLVAFNNPLDAAQSQARDGERGTLPFLPTTTQTGPLVKNQGRSQEPGDEVLKDTTV